MDRMRAFVAILPPPEVVEHLEDFLAPRREALAERRQWRWTRTEHLHITLAFIPELEDWREEALVEAGQEWAGRQDPVHLRLARAGAFPDPGAARVLWAGVEELDAQDAGAAGPDAGATGPDAGAPGPAGGPTLGTWAKGLRAIANHAGVRVDGTRFHPHLTLARAVGGPRPAGHLLQSLDTLRAPAWPVGQVALVASHLGEGPRRTPRYEVRHAWSLGTPAED